MRFLPPPITPKQIKARYPYQFFGPHIELSFYKGWMPIFAQLCADIDAELGLNKRSFHWRQLKEKFGSARWYSQMDPLLETQEDAEDLTHLSIAEVNERVLRLADPNELALRQRIQTLRRDAEAATQTTCIVCGEAGEADRGTGYHLVICPEHARQRRRGNMEQSWFEDEEKGPHGVQP
jgi:hypothetical protein